MGMAHSFADLPPISEDRLHDGILSYSYDDLSMEGEALETSAHDPSGHRKRFLVHPSQKNLGQKASTVDVHQCSSATCRICSYKPRDVCFIDSPARFAEATGSPKKYVTSDEDNGISYLPAAYSREESGVRKFEFDGSQESIDGSQESIDGSQETIER